MPERGLAGVRGRHVQGEYEQRGGDGKDAVREGLDAAGLVDLERRAPTVSGRGRRGRHRLDGTRLRHGGVIGGAEHGPGILPDTAAIGVILRYERPMPSAAARGRRTFGETAAVRATARAGQGGRACPTQPGARRVAERSPRRQRHVPRAALWCAPRLRVAPRLRAPRSTPSSLRRTARSTARATAARGWAPSAPSPPRRVSAPSAVSAPPSQVSVDVLATRWSGRFATRTAHRATTTASLGIPSADTSPGRPAVTPGGHRRPRRRLRRAGRRLVAHRCPERRRRLDRRRSASGRRGAARGARRARIHHRGGRASA